MAHVSKKPLKKEIKARVLRQFVVLVAKLDTSTAASFLSELLTETEQIMFAKRLAVILLFCEGLSQYKIWKLLHMSSSTVAQMYRRYEEGDYDAIVRRIGRNKKDREKMWQTIEVILRLGMPPMGKDRWRWLDKHLAHNYPKSHRRRN